VPLEECRADNASTRLLPLVLNSLLSRDASVRRHWPCRHSTQPLYPALSPALIIRHKNHNSSLSPSTNRIIKSMRIGWAEHMARRRTKTNVYGVILLTPEGNRPLGRRRSRREASLKISVRRMGLGDMNCIHLALVDTVMNLRG
jgi:hypothetical protein